MTRRHGDAETRRKDDAKNGVAETWDAAKQ